MGGGHKVGVLPFSISLSKCQPIIHTHTDRQTDRQAHSVSHSDSDTLSVPFRLPLSLTLSDSHSDSYTLSDSLSLSLSLCLSLSLSLSLSLPLFLFGLIILCSGLAESHPSPLAGQTLGFCMKHRADAQAADGQVWWGAAGP